MDQLTQHYVENTLMENRSTMLKRTELTRSITSVASGVLLVLGGMSLSRGRQCWDCEGMFLMNVNLEKTTMLLEIESTTSVCTIETSIKQDELQKLFQKSRFK